MARNIFLACALAMVVLSARGAASIDSLRASNPAEETCKEIEAFNKRSLEAHLKMDNAAVVLMWTDDGVSLLPQTPPIVGKVAIAKFLNEVTDQLKGYRMETMELDFQGIEASRGWASEWAREHQVAQPPPGKPVFDGRGKMLRVLHKEADGNWRIASEMWNQGTKP